MMLMEPRQQPGTSLARYEKKDSLLKRSLRRVPGMRVGKTVTLLRYAVSKLEMETRHSEALAASLAPKEAEFKHISFTFAIISLSARLATADGAMTRESYLAFRDAFPLSGGLCPKLRKLFVLAMNDPTPIDHYVQQVKYVFPRNRVLFEALVSRLFAVASSGSPLSKKQQVMISKIAHMLELSPGKYAELYEQHTARKPHHVLGTEKRAKFAQVKRRYYQLMQRYHPDRYVGEELSPEVAQILSLRTAEISAAYKALSKKAA